LPCSIRLTATRTLAAATASNDPNYSAKGLSPSSSRSSLIW